MEEDGVEGVGEFVEVGREGEGVEGAVFWWFVVFWLYVLFLFKNFVFS